MPSVGHSDYDANLLASAPVATKAQLQSGYTTDLLEDRKPADSRPTDLEAGRNNVDKPPSVTPNTTDDSIPPKPSSIPFHRTRRGIIIISVVAVVAFAAIIGGAVGGSLAKKSGSTQSAPGSQAGGVQSGDSVGFSPTKGSTPVSPTVIPTTEQGSGSTAGGAGGTTRRLAMATPAPDWQELGLAT